GPSRRSERTLPKTRTAIGEGDHARGIAGAAAADGCGKGDILAPDSGVDRGDDGGGGIALAYGLRHGSGTAAEVPIPSIGSRDGMRANGETRRTEARRGGTARGTEVTLTEAGRAIRKDYHAGRTGRAA